MPYTTPGVYISEGSNSPHSVVAVATGIPVFIGYTQMAERNGQSLLHVPFRISSMREYINFFGEGFTPKFKIAAATVGSSGDIFLLDGKKMQLQINPNNSLFFYNCIRFYYQNGGGDCYILSVGTYAGKPNGIAINPEDFTGNSSTPDVFAILEKENEAAVVVLPDIIANGTGAYPVYQRALQHCAKTQCRFAIFDVWQSGTANTEQDVQQFRDGIGIDNLKYGAAYYPWLKTSVIPGNEIDFINLDETVDLAAILPEAGAKKIAADMKALPAEELLQKRVQFHQSLTTCSTMYKNIMETIRAHLNLLPPAAAMAGIYHLTDQARGVWKAPANVSIATVNAPAVNISEKEQQDLNVDMVNGKSINIIRTFPGIGTLVWGARTLDGNSQDWKYVSVRRTMMMIEQSVKLALRSFVFEPNAAGTWVTIKTMIENFLFNLWKQGALQGIKPDQAYSVQVGLGITMTAGDILNGLLKINVLVAVVRPAEFIEITFQQQQQQS